MGIMDKLTFWKKEEQYEPSEEKRYTDLSDDPFSQNSMNDDHFSNNKNISNNQFQQPNSFKENNFNQRNPYNNEAHEDINMNKPFEMKEKPLIPQQNHGNMDLLNKNIEIISSKLDTLKAELDSMNQRLIGIESATRKKEEPVRRYQW
jgi:hypothetical protein